MKERRKIDRKYLLYYARIFDPATRHQVGNLVDITPRGIMVLSPDPFEVGKKYQLQLELSEEVSNLPYINLTGIAKWSHPDIDPHLYNTGFELVKISPEEKEIITRIIGIFGFRDNIRFKE